MLTNVLAPEVSAHQIALWCYWRWPIETFPKPLKSHDQKLEQWQQQSGEAIAGRILVASMACVVVWSLQNDDSVDAEATKKILVRLSGRQMKAEKTSTAPALLAGYMVLLAFNDLLTETDIDIGQLKRIAEDAMPFKVLIFANAILQTRCESEAGAKNIESNEVASSIGHLFWCDSPGSRLDVLLEWSA